MVATLQAQDIPDLMYDVAFKNNAIPLDALQIDKKALHLQYLAIRIQGRL
jgi:hypothetical protein